MHQPKCKFYLQSICDHKFVRSSPSACVTREFEKQSLFFVQNLLLSSLAPFSVARRLRGFCFNNIKTTTQKIHSPESALQHICRQFKSRFLISVQVCAVFFFLGKSNFFKKQIKFSLIF